MRSVLALWPQTREADPPAIHCQLLVQLDDAAGMERMLASPQRQALRPRVLELVAAFDGHLAHIDYEATTKSARAGSGDQRSQGGGTSASSA